ARLLTGRVDGSTTGEWRWSVTTTTDGRESPITGGGVGSGAYWVDSVTIAMREHNSQGWRLSLLDVRTNARRAIVTLPDSSTDQDFSPLPGGGWAWGTPDSRSIALQPAGASSQKRIPIPAWYATTITSGASDDGRRVAMVGWSAPSGDSL